LGEIILTQIILQTISFMQSSILVMMLLFFTSTFYGQNLLSKKVHIELKEANLVKSLDELARVSGIYFAYGKSIVNSPIKINMNKEASVSFILDSIMKMSGMEYFSVDDQIVIRKSATKSSNRIVKIMVLDQTNHLPIPYSALLAYPKRQYYIANENGVLKLITTDFSITDSFIISSIGYKSHRISVDKVMSSDFFTLYLTPKDIPLDTVLVSAKALKTDFTMNHSSVSLGTVYLDTHGQQTALYIRNNHKEGVKIKSFCIYLSKKGNTKAPLRIHLYTFDSTSQKPLLDILPEPIIVLPKGKKGWIQIDLAQYNLYIPKNGIFAAVEGIYAGNQEDKKNNLEDDTEAADLLSYGQKIGYNLKRKNQTWHYSLDQEWFQIPKKYFNIMISLEIFVI